MGEPDLPGLRVMLYGIADPLECSDEPWDAAEAIRASKDRFVLVRESRLCSGCLAEVEADMACVSEALAQMAAEKTPQDALGSTQADMDGPKAHPTCSTYGRTP